MKKFIRRFPLTYLFKVFYRGNILLIFRLIKLNKPQNILSIPKLSIPNITFAKNNNSLFYRCGLMPERKVGTTQSTILPNGKVPRKDEVTDSATENNRSDLLE